MPLSCTIPQQVSSKIVWDQDSARDYIQACVSRTRAGRLAQLHSHEKRLLRSDKPLFRELGALDTQEANVKVAERTVPPWNITKLVVLCTSGSAVHSVAPLS